ncbi:hypothetical protein CcaCcLH18_01455 [Colletotrichum camelliae]|nr:hypothetical protein CcaCcLH18_01455 [Colletotrichum camelliae]
MVPLSTTCGRGLSESEPLAPCQNRSVQLKKTQRYEELNNSAHAWVRALNSFFNMDVKFGRERSHTPRESLLRHIIRSDLSEVK